jgi:hypothetical protein
MNTHIAIKAETLRQWWGASPLPDCHLFTRKGVFDAEARVDMIHILITRQLREPTEDQRRASIKMQLDTLVKTIQAMCQQCVAKEYGVTSTLLGVIDGHLVSTQTEISEYTSINQEYQDDTWLVPTTLLQRWAQITSPEELHVVSNEMRSILDTQWFSCWLAEDDRNIFGFIEDTKSIRSSLVSGDYFEAEFKAGELLAKITQSIEAPYYDILRCIPKDQLEHRNFY